MSEAQHEHEQRQPLLNSVDNTEVYPIIHMIKAVSPGLSFVATFGGLIVLCRMLRCISAIEMRRAWANELSLGDTSSTSSVRGPSMPCALRVIPNATP